MLVARVVAPFLAVASACAVVACGSATTATTATPSTASTAPCGLTPEELAAPTAPNANYVAPLPSAAPVAPAPPASASP